MDVRERPLRLQSGLGALATQSQNSIFVPLAIEYTFWDEPRPEILVSFGEPPVDAPRLSIQEALQLASEQVRERLRGASTVPPLAEQLTPREWEVAQLIARGYSTRAVADALTISGGTARAHVDRIRTKLGYISRADIAARLALSQG